jgi:hypothetical protein
MKLKSTGKPELEVPFLEIIKEIDGETYKFKNDNLRGFNFIHNFLIEKSYEDLIFI